MDSEFQDIFYEDCYGLAKIEGQVKTSLDVGSNLGFFSLAAVATAGWKCRRMEVRCSRRR